MTRFDVDVFVTYGQAYLTSGAAQHDETDIHAFYAGQSNGICGAAVPGVILLMTAAHTGMEPFRITVLDAEPALSDAWEDVVEVSFRPATRRMSLAGLMSDPAVDFELDPGDYRVRYSVRGADAAYDGANGMDTSRALDAYALEFWPAPPAADAVLRRMSSRIAGMHASWTVPSQRPRRVSTGGPTIPVGYPISRIPRRADDSPPDVVTSSSSVTPDGDGITVTVTRGEASATTKEANEAVLRMMAARSRRLSPEEKQQAAEENLRNAAASMRRARDDRPTL